MSGSTTEPPGAETFPGYAVPAGTYVAAPVRRTSYPRVLLIWGIGILVAAGAMVGLSAKRAAPPVLFACPPECGNPPTGIPVQVNPRFTAVDGSFSVSYPAPGTAYDITTDPNGVEARFTAGDGGVMHLFSEPAHGRTPKEIAQTLVSQTFKDTRVAYEIPNAMVGYVPGYGEVVDCWPQGSSGSYLRMRVVVMVSVKNDLALIAGAVGPFRKFGPDFGPGKPSGANLQLALDLGKYVNSFVWGEDPSR